ncbi:hypothetical protein [macacine gammaherpesvirus 13]|uniref:BLRF2 n=1 Tax=macacine gammaherpesvirus 13 TaxID=2341050 RepID=A0A3G1T4E9_9GAMA|nr:hypothetical protein QKT43_gp32 [Macaca arctoides gammaherpesvirus 1]AYA49817.1 hypothetical protein [Macaca arctoides gammaherpesvirus 1]
MSAPRKTRVPSGKGTAEMSVEDMAARLARLESENKALRQQVRKGGTCASNAPAASAPVPPPEPLTPRQREVMITQATGRLVSQAMQKIEDKVRKAVEGVNTRPEMEDILRNLTVRFQVSMSGAKGQAGPSEGTRPREAADPAATRRARSRSRGREVKKVQISD